MYLHYKKLKSFSLYDKIKSGDSGCFVYVLLGVDLFTCRMAFPVPWKSPFGSLSEVAFRKPKLMYGALLYMCIYKNNIFYS